MTGPQNLQAPPNEGRADADAQSAVPVLPRRVELDSASAEHDLAALVLTIIELLRQLMERQALRRVDEGDLTDDQIERIGSTLMALEERMTELCDQFGLTLSDLNLDLGPLGTLLPQQ